ncbi:MAG TPA: dihydroorotate dehydrogenase-like protein [Spirochaetota bacterium]|nr:dihydroorotate dehydrogenase-like protein [Spirochaetota bacterium]
MIDMTTEYLGLKLRNPLIVSSSGFTDSADKIRHIEELGAGAVVLKSLFEEQILMDSESISAEGHGVDGYGEASDYIHNYVKENTVSEYLRLIENAKKNVTIPVIASVNCRSAKEWISFSKSIESAGADALEVNMFIMPVDLSTRGEDLEKIYFDVVSGIVDRVKLPLALKIGTYFSSMANMIVSLSHSDVSGLVLFNRFYSPDIDVESMEITSAPVLSRPEEISLPLRWIGMLYGKVGCDLTASTGIHDAHGMAKVILAGAACAQVATAFYDNGIEYIQTILQQFGQWMKEKGYSSPDEFRGLLSRSNVADPQQYERSQFMKYFSNYQK